MRQTQRRLSPVDAALIGCMLTMIFCWGQAALHSYPALRALMAADMAGWHTPHVRPPIGGS